VPRGHHQIRGNWTDQSEASDVEDETIGIKIIVSEVSIDLDSCLFRCSTK